GRLRGPRRSVFRAALALARPVLSPHVGELRVPARALEPPSRAAQLPARPGGGGSGAFLPDARGRAPLWRALGDVELLGALEMDLHRSRLRGDEAVRDAAARLPGLPSLRRGMHRPPPVPARLGRGARLDGAAGRSSRRAGDGGRRHGRCVPARRPRHRRLVLRPGEGAASAAGAGAEPAGRPGPRQPGEGSPRPRRSADAGAPGRGERARPGRAGARARKREARAAPGTGRGPRPPARAPWHPARGRPRALAAGRARGRVARPGRAAEGPLPRAEGGGVDPRGAARSPPQRAANGAESAVVPHFRVSSPLVLSLSGVSSIVKVSTLVGWAFETRGTSMGSPDSLLTSICHLSGAVLVAVRTYSPGGTTTP